MFFYVAVRAADRFYTQHGRYPGATDDTLEADLSILRALVDSQLLKEMGVVGVTVESKYLQEMYVSLYVAGA